MSPLVNMLSEKLQFLVLSLNAVTLLIDFEEILQLEFVSDIYKEIITLLSELVPDARFFNFFNQNCKAIISNICLPIIKTNANEMEHFIDNPDEFVAYSNDLCEKQRSETYKSSTIQLLLSICEYIDGALTFTWLLCYQMSITGVNNQSLSETCDISQYSSSALIKYSGVNLLECALMNFCVLNSLAYIRNDLIKYLEEFLKSNLKNFYSAAPLIKNRLCLLIRFYSQSLFYHEENYFFEMIKYIISCCNNNENPLLPVNIQGSEALSFMLQEEEILLRIFNFLPNIFKYLIEIIKFQNNKQFFEVLYEMVDTNISVVLPFIDILIPNLVAKIAEVHRNSFEQKKKDKIIIDKC